MPAGAEKVVGRAGDAVIDYALRPTIEATLGLLELIDAWILELTNPARVVETARKQGIEIEDFLELRTRDLKDCDRLLSRHTLQWRTVGALEGGAMGAVALVPIAGIPVSITADVVVIQAMSVAIASRVAYSYGFDAKDPDEQAFINHLVGRAFLAQAAKAKPLVDAHKAGLAIRLRIRWSDKIRTDHRVVAALEKLLAKWHPNGVVPIQSVKKAIPFVSILLGAGSNAWLLGKVAEDTQRFCATRFLCDKYKLPMPIALRRYGEQPPDNTDAEE